MMRNCGRVAIGAVAMLWGAAGVGADGTYVDMRSGFSLELGADWELYGGCPTDEVAQAGSKQGWVDLAGWEAVKIPASKELVRFGVAAGDRKQYLTVDLLVLKRDLEVGEIVTARRQYWERNPTRVIVTEGPALSARLQTTCGPAGFLTVLWRSEDQVAWQWFIREALIRSERGRYFLLRLVVPAGVRRNDNGPEPDIERLTSSFVCFGEAEVRRRWARAGQNGRDLIKRRVSVASGQECYRVMRGGNEIGFLVVTVERKAATGVGPGQVVGTNICGYVADGDGGVKLAGMLGWAGGPGQMDSGRSSTGPLTLAGEIILDPCLGQETFEFTVASPGNTRGYGEEGMWQGGRLSLKRWDDVTQRERVIEAELEVKQDLYLPWSAWRGMGKLLDGKGAQEYVVMLYGNRGLGHCTIKSGPQEAASGGAAQKRDEEPLNTYVVAQMSADGPVVESWFSGEGTRRLLRQRSDGVTLESCDMSRLEQHWARELQEMNIGEQMKD